MDGIESIKLDEDEGQSILRVTTDDGDTLTLRVSGIDLWRQIATVGREASRFVQEHDDAHAEWVANGLRLRRLSEDEFGYDVSDPKHPGYLDRADTIRDRL